MKKVHVPRLVPVICLVLLTLLLISTSGCSRARDGKDVMGKILETYKKIDSCVLDYVLRTEVATEVYEIRGTVYARKGDLRYEESTLSQGDTLRQVRVLSGETIYQLMPDRGIARGQNLEPGAREANLRAVEQRGALVSVMPIPDESWKPRGRVRTETRDSRKFLVIEAFPPGFSSDAVQLAYTFVIDPKTYLVHEIEYSSLQQSAAGALKSKNTMSYRNYRIGAEIPDSIFVVDLK